MRAIRIIVVVLGLLALAYLANVAGDWISGRLKMEITPENESFIFGVTTLAIILYALLIALPFVPGVEIGIGLMVMFGPSMAIPVYLSTVIGLCLGFVLGRLVPEKALRVCFDFVGLSKISRMLLDVSARPMEERLAALTSRAPTRIVPYLLRHRYVATAVAFNIPGNSVIGGGGGIAFMAGTSRLFAFPLFLMAVAIGVSPVTILVLTFGSAIFS